MDGVDLLEGGVYMSHHRGVEKDSAVVVEDGVYHDSLDLSTVFIGNDLCPTPLFETDLQENENLKRELAIARRNAEKYERMVGLTQNSPQSSTSPRHPRLFHSRL